LRAVQRGRGIGAAATFQVAHPWQQQRQIFSISREMAERCRAIRRRCLALEDQCEQARARDEEGQHWPD
jgi:hypothetical protein